MIVQKTIQDKLTNRFVTNFLMVENESDNHTDVTDQQIPHQAAVSLYLWGLINYLKLLIREL